MDAPKHPAFPRLLQEAPAVQRLPDLVLLEIFSNVGAITPDFDSWRWMLSQVSYKWRSVLLPLPSFWSNIHLPFSNPNTPGFSSPSLLLHRLTLQLKRSQTHPLTISLCLETSTLAHPHLEILLKLLCTESPRWQNLSPAADLPNLHFLYSILDREGKGFPGLQSLDLILPPHNSSPFSSASIALFENASHLTDLTITHRPMRLRNQIHRHLIRTNNAIPSTRSVSRAV